jgi:hypothetical protein
MRFLGLAALLLAPLGCSKVAQTPTPGPATTPAPGGSVHPAVPSTILYTTGSLGGRTLMAVLEDGSAAPRAISAAGADTTFVTTLADRRVLAVEHQNDGQDVSQLVIVALDGSRQALVTPAGYNAAGKAQLADDGVAVELIRTGTTGGTDLYLARASSQILLASHATLVSVAAGRVAYLASGTLRSIRTDGSGDLALGTGSDVVAQTLGDLVLFSSGADARLARLDGLATVTLPNASAFALCSGGRIVYTRAGTIFSSALDGSDERSLGAGTPILATPDGRVLAVDGSALVSLGETGGASRVLDPAAGSTLRFVRLLGDRVVYTGETTDSVGLRTARLDGGGATTLYQEDVTLPVVTGLSADGRVIFHIAYVGQLEGGQVLSVKLDGTGLMRVGSDVYDESGLRQAAPADQDFEAITPSGRLIVEVEYEGNLFGSQLLQTGASSTQATSLSEFGGVRFSALIP